MIETMDLLDRFERYLRNSGKSEVTISNWHYTIRSTGNWILKKYYLDIFEEDEVGRCKPSMFDEWYNEKIINLSSGTKHVYVLAIQKYFEYLVKYNLITDDKNPTKILPRPKRPVVFHDTTVDSDRVYTEDEIKKMLTSSHNSYGSDDDAKFRAIVALFIESGLRASELCSITVGDIRNCKNNTIKVLRKGGKYNGVVIGDSAWPYIKEYYNVARKEARDDDAFFVTHRHTAYTRKTLYSFIVPRQKELGIKSGLHNFRHTATSNIAKAGDMAIARDFAGHANVIMTNRYTHTSIEDRLAAVNNSNMSKLLNSIYSDDIEDPIIQEDEDENVVYDQADKEESMDDIAKDVVFNIPGLDNLDF